MIFLISLVAIGLTVFLYYKTLAFAPLRILSIILLYILITGFVLSYTINKKANPPVLLIDHSASMTKYLNSMQKPLSEIKFEHNKFYFSETLFTDALKETLLSSRFTDIGKALKDVSKKNPAIILLISDGNHNYGHFPFPEIKRTNIPVYTFGVGSEKTRDVAISDVVYPTYVFINDSIKIEVIVESHGFSSGSAQVTLQYNNKKTKKPLLLNDKKAKTNLEFSINITDLERSKVLIDISRQADELNYENNQIEFSFQVLQRKTRAIYYTDHLSFNTKFLLRTLLQDDYINLIPLARLNDSMILNLTDNQMIRDLPTLENIDVIITDNINLKNIPWKNIEGALSKGMGLLCIGSIQGQNVTWNEILPIHTAGAIVRGNFPLTIKEPFSCLTPGNDYPPIVAINRVLGVEDGATVIAQTNNVPIIAYHNFGTGTVFHINAIDIGTWQFLQLGLKQKDLFAVLISDILRFLSPIGKNKRLFLSTLRSIYDVGEIIPLKLQSYNRNYKLSGGGDFIFEYDDTKIPFFEIGKGIYEASLLPKQAGDISLKASGKLEDEALTSNILNLTIAGTATETDQGLNRHFMETLASETDGKYFMFQGIEDFEIPEPKNIHYQMRINFDSPISYILILVLLIIDWTIRRRRGII